MLWVISAVFLIWCLVLEYELLKIKKIKNILNDSNKKKDEELKHLQSYCDHFQSEAYQSFNEKAAAIEQAKAFQSAAKTMEEHLAAERSRVDRLAEALQESEAARFELLKKLEQIRKAEHQDAQMQKEMQNILRYDGTAQSQEDLNDAG